MRFSSLLTTIRLSPALFLTHPGQAQTENYLVDTVRFRPDGKTLVAHSRQIRGAPRWFQTAVYDASDRKVLRTFSAEAVLFAPDNSYYVASGTPMRAFNLKDLPLRSFPSSGTQSPHDFSPDGKILIGGGPYFNFWDAKSGARILSIDSGTYPIHFSPDSRYFYDNRLQTPTLYQVVRNIKPPRIGKWKTIPIFKRLHFYHVASGDCYDFDVDFRKKWMAAIWGPHSVDKTKKVAFQITLSDLHGQLKTKLEFGGYAFYGNPPISVRLSADVHLLAVRDTAELAIYAIPSLQLLRRYKPSNFGMISFLTDDFSPTENRLAIGGYGRSKPVVLRLP